MREEYKTILADELDPEELLERLGLTTEDLIRHFEARIEMNIELFEDVIGLQQLEQDVFSEDLIDAVTDWDEGRMDIIGQNGNEGDHYE